MLEPAERRHICSATQELSDWRKIPSQTQFPCVQKHLPGSWLDGHRSGCGVPHVALWRLLSTSHWCYHQSSCSGAFFRILFHCCARRGSRTLLCLIFTFFDSFILCSLRRLPPSACHKWNKKKHNALCWQLRITWHQ